MPPEAFTAPFEPPSRDPREVDAYVTDPLCGFFANAASMHSLIAAAAPLFAPDALQRIGRICRTAKAATSRAEVVAKLGRWIDHVIG